mmetsp:Transcript_18694/g.59645  ORF Transcript_18694/g.59645 Transcript_18694/m.59645 type:complete len:293 (-) Transcript_18694:342-1220(-)
MPWPPGHPAVRAGRGRCRREAAPARSALLQRVQVRRAGARVLRRGRRANRRVGGRQERRRERRGAQGADRAHARRAARPCLRRAQPPARRRQARDTRRRRPHGHGLGHLRLRPGRHRGARGGGRGRQLARHARDDPADRCRGRRPDQPHLPAAPPRRGLLGGGRLGPLRAAPRCCRGPHQRRRPARAARRGPQPAMPGRLHRAGDRDARGPRRARPGALGGRRRPASALQEGPLSDAPRGSRGPCGHAARHARLGPRRGHIASQHRCNLRPCSFAAHVCRGSRSHRVRQAHP